MKRFVLSVLVVLLLAAPAFADITMTSAGSGKGPGMNAKMQTTTYIKGMKMRSEVTSGSTVLVTIRDLEAGKLIIVNVKKKEADIYDLAKMAAEIAKQAGTAPAKMKFAATGQKKEIAGRNCAGYEMSIMMPMAVGGGGSDEMVMSMSGPVWIAVGAPGTAEFVAYHKMAVEKGYMFDSPEQAKSQAAQARAVNEMYRQLVAAGGLPYAQEIAMKVEGSGMIAGMMNKIGGISMSSTVTEVTVGPLTDDLFAVPADFKSKIK
jgi:hypothetical protein